MSPIQGREYPESMLLVVLFLLMCTLSFIFLSFQPLDLSMSCSFCIQCTALAFFTSPVFTALFCTVILTFNGLPVSPCAHLLTLLGRIRYIMPLFTCLCGSFTLISNSLMLLLCWNTGCSPYSLHMLPNLPDVPVTKGIIKISFW